MGINRAIMILGACFMLFVCNVKADPSSALLDADYSESGRLTATLTLNSPVTRRAGCDIIMRISMAGNGQTEAVYETRASKVKITRGKTVAVFKATELSSAKLIDGNDPIASFQAFVFCSAKNFFYSDSDATFIHCDSNMEMLEPREFALSVRRKLKLIRTS